jgi:hypothetical protein
VDARHSGTAPLLIHHSNLPTSEQVVDNSKQNFVFDLSSSNVCIINCCSRSPRFISVGVFIDSVDYRCSHANEHLLFRSNLKKTSNQDCISSSLFFFVLKYNNRVAELIFIVL